MCEVIHNAIYGKVYHGIVLRRSSSTDVWHMTNEECAIKAMTWDQIRAGRERHLIENPQDEISAMQHLKRRLDDTGGRNISVDEAMRESNVIMSLDFLYDERNLYTITPYCRGELLDVLQERERFTEPESRYLLSSMLVGLESLQRAGLCHRDISLENIMVDHERTFVIDMGQCLRIPFLDDEEGREQRRLIRNRPRAGKFYYMSPEVYNEQTFDGHAIDMWAVGVCLFMMLTGMQPWDIPSSTNHDFRHMSAGSLVYFLTNDWRFSEITLSADAMDLLQRMLFENPQDRLSLQQVRAHPWMQEPMTNPMNTI